MMDARTKIHKFFELAAEVERIDEGLSEPLEPALEAVLTYVLSHPELKHEFVHAFLQMARDPNKGPPELIQYCMHALRWPEVKQEFVTWLETEKSERVRHVLRKLIMSFNDDWYDADAYVRFGGIKGSDSLI